MESTQELQEELVRRELSSLLSLYEKESGGLERSFIEDKVVQERSFTQAHHQTSLLLQAKQILLRSLQV